MTNTIITKIKPIETLDTTAYEYLLAVSSDSLYILSSNNRIVDTIIQGLDNIAWVFSADTKDEFLDAIIVLKQDIISGCNPLDRIL